MDTIELFKELKHNLMEEVDIREGTESRAEVSDSRFREEIYSKSVRAGKRTYFFDVKVTRKDEYYLTITESKKKIGSGGKAFYEKHKIFLYKEDFTKFSSGLEEVISFIQEKQPYITNDEGADIEMDKLIEKSYTDVEFEDLPAV